MQQGVECQPVPPTAGEVIDVHALVSLRTLTAPGQQGSLQVGLSKVIHHIFHNVLDLLLHREYSIKYSLSIAGIIATWSRPHDFFLLLLGLSF